jgi:putative tricarboxylic transport membrane protein
MVSLSILVFAVMLKTMGLLVAAVSVVVVGALGGARYRWWELALLASVLSGFCALLFVFALNQPLPLWR